MDEDEQLTLEFRGHRFGITSCRRVREAYVRVDLWRDGRWQQLAAGLRVGEAEDKFRRGIDFALRYAYEHEEGVRE